MVEAQMGDAFDAAGLGEDVFGGVIFDPAAAGELESVDDVPWVGIGFEGLDGGGASTLMGMKPDCFMVPWQSA